MVKNRNNYRVDEDITPKNVIENEYFENASVPADVEEQEQVQTQ